MSFIFTCFQTFIAFLCKCYDFMYSLPITYNNTTITNSSLTFLKEDDAMLWLNMYLQHFVLRARITNNDNNNNNNNR